MSSTQLRFRVSMLALFSVLAGESFARQAVAATDSGSGRPRMLAAHTAAREWAAKLALQGADAVPLVSPRKLGPAAAGADSLAQRTLRVRGEAEAAWSEERWSVAAALYAELASWNPYDAEAWELLGLARHHAEDFRGAIAAFVKAAEAGAGFPFDPPYNVACCLARLGEREQALLWLDRAFALGYRYLENLRTDEDLASLRDDPHFRELAAMTDVTALSRDEAWRFDLALLDRELRRIHLDPYRVTPREQLDAMVRALHDDIPRLSDEQVAVGLMKLVAAVGDAHTRVGPAFGPDEERKVLPIVLYLFVEGLYVTAADSAHADLVGAQIVAIEGNSVDRVMDALATVIPRDSDLWLRFQGPRWMVQPRVMHGLGLTRRPDGLTLTVLDAAGTRRDASLTADVTAPADDWVSGRRSSLASSPASVRLASNKYAFELLPDTRALYVAYNTLIEDPQAPLETFFGRMFAFADSAGAQRLVIDLRRNAGGNNFLNRPLWQGIVARPNLNQRGRIFVLVGRNTFSAAICSSVQLARHTNAILIGEPTSSPPNFTGETIVVNLPHSRMRATISDLYWQNGMAMDYRAWVAPELYVPPTWADFRDGRDPALAAALGWPEPAPANR